MTSHVVHFLLTALTAGIIAGAAMETVLWLVGTLGWAKANMIVALGSLFTKSRHNAWKVGLVLHITAAVGFAMLYTLVMLKLGWNHLPHSLTLGAAMGLAHGLIVSLGLVWVVAEQHPLEEFNEAGLAIGLSHILGHLIYGAVIGLVVGISAGL